MAKKDKHNGGGIFPSLHIKKGTSGTSNEISLSVLDGLKEQNAPAESSIDTQNVGGVWLQTNGKRLGRRRGKATTVAPTPPTLASNSAAVDSTTPSGGVFGKKNAKAKERARARAVADPEAEIARRKSRRRIRQIVILVLVLGAVGFGCYSGITYLINQQQAYQEDVSLLNQGFDELIAADNLVLSMDDLVTGDLTTATTDQISEVEQGIKDAEVHLSAAESFAQGCQSNLATTDEKEAANKVIASAAARREMMGQATILLEANAAAINAMDSINECWTLILQANDAYKNAASLVADTTNENTSESEDLSYQAIDLLQQAEQKLYDAQYYYPNADLSAFEPYIEKCIEACQYAIASDEAIYLQDKSTAEENNDLYNEADAEAIELAKALPSNPTTPILDALEVDTAEARDAYLDSRTEAAQSDAFIRDYLGETNS